MNNFWEEPEYQALYEIPFEQLGLSENATRLLERVSISSVGDCIDYYFHRHYAMITAPPGYLNAMENEVKDKLQEHGYWSFYEKNAQRGDLDT